MCEIVQLKGYVCELNFGYNAKMEVYAKSSSDITKLYEMAPLRIIILLTLKRDEHDKY